MDKLNFMCRSGRRQGEFLTDKLFDVNIFKITFFGSIHEIAAYLNVNWENVQLKISRAKVFASEMLSNLTR